MVNDSEESKHKDFQYTEVLERLCPYYLSIGVTYDEYWHGEPERLKFAREADKLMRKRENFDLWLQGRYMYEAIICASPATNPFSKAKKCYPYPEQPFPLTKEEAEQRAEEEQIKRYQEMRSRMMAEYNAQEEKKRKEGEQNG